jgi:hypothetical protein
MREIRTSGSEGGGAGYSTGPPYPYPTIVPEGTVKTGRVQFGHEGYLA